MKNGRNAGGVPTRNWILITVYIYELLILALSLIHAPFTLRSFLRRLVPSSSQRSTRAQAGALYFFSSAAASPSFFPFFPPFGLGAGGAGLAGSGSSNVRLKVSLALLDTPSLNCLGGGTQERRGQITRWEIKNKLPSRNTHSSIQESQASLPHTHCLPYRKDSLSSP